MAETGPQVPRRGPRVVGDWRLEQRIGSGSFSVVWRAARVGGEGCSTAAVKEIATDRLNDKLRESLSSELSILRATRHENIVNFYGIHKESNRIFIVLEHCSGGDLSAYIRRVGRVSEAFARRVLSQVAAGLQELRRHNVVHRDLKPQNLLLSDQTPDAVLKIADFGFARNLQPQGLAETLCGSPLYMAPEILRFQKYDAKADLWSVGAILYELVVGRPPFDGDNTLHLLRNIERQEVRVPDKLARGLSAECQDLIYKLLKRNPLERITFEEFFTHAFICQDTSQGRVRDAGWRRAVQAQGPMELDGVQDHVFVAPGRGRVGKGFGMASVPEEVCSEADEQEEHRLSSAGESSSTVATGSVTNGTLGQELVAGGAAKLTVGPDQALKDAEDLSDSFDKDFVLIDLPSPGPSGSQQSHTGSSTLEASRQASQSSSLTHVQPPPSQMAHLLDVATLVHQLALAKQDGGFPGDAFAAAMLALQVLDRAGQLQLRGSPFLHQGIDAAGLGLRMGELLQLCEGVSRALGASDQQALPNVYEMVFQHALSFSRGAAADELMGNYARSSELYAKALDLLWFLSQEAPQLALQPQIMLSPQEATRLQQYMATVGARRSACSSMPNL
eukprot:evm.model.scf_1271.1 EVM.evm.TU.scf_1271.1   scf_1271:4023-7984(-)